MIASKTIHTGPCITVCYDMLTDSLGSFAVIAGADGISLFEM